MSGLGFRDARFKSDIQRWLRVSAMRRVASAGKCILALRHLQINMVHYWGLRNKNNIISYGSTKILAKAPHLV